MILIVAFWSRVTFIISNARICVSISLYYFLFIVEMETVETPLLELPVLPNVGEDMFEMFCSSAVGYDEVAES
jgi:hypothetical protein